MKNKRNILIILLLIVIGMIPSTSLAYTYLVTYEKFNLDFYVEDEKGSNYKDLSFSIHTLDNKISYNIYYDNSTNLYRVSDRYGTMVQESDVDTNYFFNAFFTEEEIEQIKTGNLNPDNYEEEIFDCRQLSSFTCSQPSTTGYYKYVPLILEEKNINNNNYEPIKKVIYGVIHIIYYPEETMPFFILNVESNAQKSSLTDNNYNYATIIDPGGRISVLRDPSIYFTQLEFTRKSFVDYFAGVEEMKYGVKSKDLIVNENYLNRSTDSSPTIISTSTKPAAPFTSSETSSSETQTFSTYTNGKVRLTSMNVPETSLESTTTSNPVILKLPKNFVYPPMGEIDIPNTLKNLGIPLLLLVISSIGSGLMLIGYKNNGVEDNK